MILISEVSQPVSPKQEPVAKPLPMSESLSCPSSMIYLSSPSPDEETSTTDESPSPEKQISSESISVPIMQDDSINHKEETKGRFHGTSVLGNRVRSYSSSPSTQHSHRRFRKPGTARKKLEKSMSCRTLGELELDEVKGFMDLGFTFKKETLSPRMMSVVPGLHRLGSLQSKHNNTETPIDATEIVRNYNIDTKAEQEKRDGIMRPYLSEAWLIKRPDSPLLNLRIPKSCSSTNMKKHLRFWAKTVASEIQQE